MREAMKFAIVALAMAAGAAKAAPLVDSQGGFEVNWSLLRLRFFGEAKASFDGEADALRNAERLAWQGGVALGAQAAHSLLLQRQSRRSSENDGAAPGREAQPEAAALAAMTRSVGTTYFGDGTVRVLLEAPLGQLLTTPELRFRQKLASEPGNMQFTGIVVRLNKAASPRADYRLVDESGQTLFEAADMAEDAFRHHLMGRWYRRPTAGELGDAVGANPAALDVQVIGDGVWRVEQAAWQQVLNGHRSLLVNGRIVIALP